MKIFLYIALGFCIIALVGFAFYDLNGQFDFITFFNPIWTFLDNTSDMMQHIFEWFKTLIGWINPTTTTFTGRIITC